MAIYVPQYPKFGGQQRNIAALRNVIAQAGLHNPHTQQPYSEAMITGLGSGLGFQYTVSVADTLPRVSVATHDTHPRHSPVRAALQRVGARVAVFKTGSRRHAGEHLLDTLRAGMPALCRVSTTHLPHCGRPAPAKRLPTHIVAVVGAEDQRVFLDDLSERSVPVPAGVFAQARGALRRLQHQQLTISATDPVDDLDGAIRAAMRDMLALFSSPPNQHLGASGIQTWARMLTNDRHKRGWMRMLDDPRALYGALWQSYAGLRGGRSTPGAGRPLYADFLVESASILGEPALHQAAGLFRRSGELWERLCDLLLPEEIPTLWQCRRLTDQRQGMLQTSPDPERLQALWRARELLGRRFRYPGSQADRLFRFKTMAATLDEIGDVEQRARDTIAGVAARPAALGQATRASSLLARPRGTRRPGAAAGK